jgi:hypothetical protein
MTMPDLGSMSIPEPRWLGIRETRLGNDWLARWIDADTLPAGAPAAYGYAVVLMGDKGYVTRAAGSEHWDALEGAIPAGTKPDAWLKSAARDRIGATLGKTVLIGYLECRATSHNPEFAAGTVTIRPFYAVAAKKVEDQPRDAGWERRRLPANEFSAYVRQRYPDIEEYLQKAIELVLIWKARGEV